MKKRKLEEIKERNKVICDEAYKDWLRKRKMREKDEKRKQSSTHNSFIRHQPSKSD